MAPAWVRAGCRAEQGLSAQSHWTAKLQTACHMRAPSRLPALATSSSAADKQGNARDNAGACTRTHSDEAQQAAREEGVVVEVPHVLPHEDGCEEGQHGRRTPLLRRRLGPLVKAAARGRLPALRQFSRHSKRAHRAPPASSDGEQRCTAGGVGGRRQMSSCAGQGNGVGAGCVALTPGPALRSHRDPPHCPLPIPNRQGVPGAKQTLTKHEGPPPGPDRVEADAVLPVLGPEEEQGQDDGEGDGRDLQGRRWSGRGARGGQTVNRGATPQAVQCSTPAGKKRHKPGRAHVGVEGAGEGA